MYTSKKIRGDKRKNKANELDDSFEYEPKKISEGKDNEEGIVSINDDNNSKNELSNELIN